MTERATRTKVRGKRIGMVRLSIGLAALVGLGAASRVARSLEELGRIAPELEARLDRAESRVAAVTKTVDHARERAELLQWIHDQMRHANPRLTAEEANEYARLLINVADKYVAVDPLFLLSVGLVESHFEARATSHASAKGLYQIHPPTGEWLASELGWAFEEAMLYEPERNTELAALYLEKLFATYGDPALVLAEYNGGPINARRLRSGSDRLARETREYIAKVMAKFRRLSARLEEIGVAQRISIESTDAATSVGVGGA